MTRLIDADEMLKRLESWNTDDEMDKALYNFTLSRIIEQPTVDVIPVQWLYDLAEKKEEEKDIKLSTMVKGVVALWHMEKRNEKRNNCKELVATET